MKERVLSSRILTEVRKAARTLVNPTHRKKREGPGFSARCSNHGRVCGFHQGKPHEVRCPNSPHRKSGGRGTHLFWVAGIFPLLLLLAAGCQEKTTSKPLSQLTPQEAAGQQVFARQCAACHYANTEQGLYGPGLEKMFRKPYLSSGAPANDERVTSVILRGRGMMPALGNALSDQELQELLAYLHTL